MSESTPVSTGGENKPAGILDMYKVQLSNGKVVDMMYVPTAVRFYQYLVLNCLRPQTGYMHRGRLRRMYEEFGGVCEGEEFSSMLFCLSWLDLLKVRNGSDIYFNFYPSIVV